MNYLNIIQVAVAILMVGAVLLQQRGTGLGAGFGGGSTFYATRRGIQQKLYWITIGLLAAFVALALLNLRASALR